MLTHLGLFVLWLLHFLPLSLLAPLGRGLGYALYLLAHERRHVALTNIRLCFPESSVLQQRQLVRQHFAYFGRSFLERGIQWWSRPSRLARLVKIHGQANLEAMGKRPVILLAPHFLGLDMGGTRFSLKLKMASMYSKQKNAIFNKMLLKGRARFGLQLFSRQEGIYQTIKAIRAGKRLYYLPDMDYGAQGSIFVPFFGVPAATITGLSRLARMTGAAVLPCITRMREGGQGYIVEMGPAWDNFPTEDIEADTARMNTFIETQIRTMPAQYLWVHKRFKTRPPGEAQFY